MSPSARARLARDAGAVGPVRSLRDGQAESPEAAAAAGQEPVGAAGGGGAAAAAGSFCSCSSTDRGRDTPELGKREEGSGGGGTEEEAEGGSEAAAANAARVARPSSPHASTGGG